MHFLLLIMSMSKIGQVPKASHKVKMTGPSFLPLIDFRCLYEYKYILLLS